MPTAFPHDVGARPPAGAARSAPRLRGEEEEAGVPAGIRPATPAGVAGTRRVAAAVARSEEATGSARAARSAPVVAASHRRII